MNGIEPGRQVAVLRAEGRAQAGLALLRQSQREAAASTAAEWVASAKEPPWWFGALRRRSGPDPLPVR